MTESVTNPVVEQPSAPEKLVNRPRVDFRIFPGAGFGFQNNLQESPRAFSELKGLDVKDTRVWNSMESADAVIPHRFRYIAEDLHKVLQNHNDNDPEARLAIVLHSLAGAEFGNVIQELQKKDPELLKKRINNIDFIMLGATGMEGGITNARADLNKLSRLIHSQLDSTEQLTDRVAGIESLMFIPAQNPECKDVLEVANQLYGNEEEFVEVTSKVVQYTPDSRYLETLSPEKKTALQGIEQRLAGIIKRIKSGENAKAEFEGCLNERANLLKAEAKQVYHQEMGTQNTPTEYQQALIEKTGMNRWTQALLGMVDKGRLVNSLLRGKLKQQFDVLMKIGLKPEQIKFLATRYDVFRPPPQVSKHRDMLRRQEQSPELYELAYSTHSSWMFFSSQFAEALEQIYVKE